jgi:hypothetical protein
MFWACFMYNYKRPCYIYYPETLEQKAANEEKIEQLNNKEIEDEACEVFDAQECEKERKWDKKG